MKQLIKRFFVFWSIIPFIFLGLTPIIWFWGKGNVLVNGIDTNFPLNPPMWLMRRFYVWTDFPNAGADFSSSTAGIFFHLIQVIPYKIGLTLQHVQIVSLIFWFALIVFSSYILAKTIFPKRFLIQLLFSVLYTFNVYIFNTWENVKVANLSLIAAIPLVLSILILLKEEKIKRLKVLFFSSLIGIILSGSGINPSYFLSFLFIVAIFIFSQIITGFKFYKVKTVVTNSLIVIVPIILVNLFWMLPTINFVFNNVAPGGSIDKIGFTNWVDSLSENTSLLNVMRLQGAWDWYAFDGITGLPIYIPYALNYFYRFPFIVFSFLLPTIAILALIVRKKVNDSTYLYISFSLMFIIGIFLGVGTHLPTGYIFRWLSNNIPFFTLFRSPWYIFTPLVTLSLAGLVSLFLYYLYENFGKRFRLMYPLVTLIVLVLIIGNLVYSYPLVTGKIFRPGRPDSFFINFPEYIYDAGDWLSQVNNSRIVVYPDDEIEQFKWGYRGIESILALLSNTEVIFNPLNSPDSNVVLLIKEFYKNLKKGKISEAFVLAQKLNVGFIFDKNDQESLSPSLSDKVKSNEVSSFGGWHFYKFPQDSIPKIYSPTSIFLGPIQKDGARVLGLIPKEGALLNPEDSVVKSIDALKSYYGFVLLSKNFQEEEFKNFAYSESKLNNRLVSRNLSKVDFSINIPEEGNYSPVIERYELEDFGIRVEEGLEVEVDGNKLIWNVESYSDSFVYFKKVNLPKGEHKISIKLKNENLVFGGDFNSGMNFKQGGYGEGRGEYSINEDGNGKFLQIFNVNKANVSADFSVSSFNPFTSYYVELEYKQIYGNNANVVVLQGTSNTLVKAQTERLPNYPEWNVFSFYFEPIQTNSFMTVALESPFTSDPLGTKILYDDLRVFKVFSNKLLFIKEGSNKFENVPKIKFVKKSPVSYEGEVYEVGGPHVITFSENYSPEWEIMLFDDDGKRITGGVKHFSANIYANGWFVEGVPNSYKFKIFYKPQNLFWLGLGISITTLILFAILANLNLAKRLFKEWKH